MNHSSTSTFGRFHFNMDPALFVLVIAVFFEIVLYRLLANMGFYEGVGAMGIRARIADISIFSMIFTGSLAAVLLFWAIARLVNHPNISGIWWRGILIFISPMYLLTIFWSIWTTLSNWVLAASIIGVQLTILLVCVVSILRPVSFGYRRLFGAIALISLVGATKWLTLDFFQYDRYSKWGTFLLEAYEVAQFFMVLLPVFAFFLLVANSSSRRRVLLKRPHLPSLLFAVFATLPGIATVMLIQRLTNEGNWINAGRYVMRISYQTIGLKLAWPFAAAMAQISLFFLAMTCFMLVFGNRHLRYFQMNRPIGFGLAFIYIAGLQPYTVYQLAIYLLGIILLVMGVSDTQPNSRPSMEELHQELAD